MSKEPTISIEYGDWLKEYIASAIKPVNEDDIITAMQETSLKPMQAARLAIVAREQGKADADILPSNKIVLNMGASHRLSQRIASKRKDVTVKGRKYNTRQYVGTVQEEVEGTQPEGENEMTVPSTWVRTGTTLVEVGNNGEARERARRYLLEVVPGYIRERLIIIASGGGDVKEAADALKAKIDEMVAELV